MLIEIKLSDCISLKHISCYNQNYYQLPFKINNCNVIFENFGGDEELETLELGLLDGNKFIRAFYISPDCYKFDHYIILDKEVVEENRWT